MVIFSLSETNIPFHESIQLILDVHVTKGTEVNLPDIEDQIHFLEITDTYTEPPQNLPNGKFLHRHVWELIPTISGMASIGPIKIHIGTTSVVTDFVEVQITSQLPEHLTHFEIRDIVEADECLSIDQNKQNYWIAAAGIALSLLLFSLKFRQIRKTKSAPSLTPYEAALQALKQLPENPTERIHGLNRILRNYLEDQFLYPAPGKPLTEIILDLNKTMLNFDINIIPYLEAGEQIRFSNTASEEFAEEMEQTIRSFIEQSRENACD
ncbi:MAG TPA: hypothetical protein VIR63_06910 [Pontiella sp.]